MQWRGPSFQDGGSALESTEDKRSLCERLSGGSAAVREGVSEAHRWTS